MAIVLPLCRALHNRLGFLYDDDGVFFLVLVRGNSRFCCGWWIGYCRGCLFELSKHRLHCCALASQNQNCRNQRLNCRNFSHSASLLFRLLFQFHFLCKFGIGCRCPIALANVQAHVAFIIGVFLIRNCSASIHHALMAGSVFVSLKHMVETPRKGNRAGFKLYFQCA